MIKAILFLSYPHISPGCVKLIAEANKEHHLQWDFSLSQQINEGYLTLI